MPICSAPLTYLFAKQGEQSSEQFVCGGLGVLALLGIGESLIDFIDLARGCDGGLKKDAEASF